MARAQGLPPDQRLEVLNAVLAVFFIPLVLLVIVVALVMLAV